MSPSRQPAACSVCKYWVWYALEGTYKEAVTRHQVTRYESPGEPPPRNGDLWSGRVNEGQWYGNHDTCTRRNNCLRWQSRRWEYRLPYAPPPAFNATTQPQRSISADYPAVSLQTCGRIASRNRQRLRQPSDTWMRVFLQETSRIISFAVQDNNRNTKVGTDPVPIRIVNMSGNIHTREQQPNATIILD